MARYFILVKKRGAKNWVGAIPSKKNVSLAKLRSVVRKQIRKGYTFKIVTVTAMKRLLKPKRSTKKRTRKSGKRR